MAEVKNCLSYALSLFRYRKDVYLLVRKSLHTWFPHVKVAFENGDVPVIKEFVPDDPIPRRIPPFRFKGHTKTTVYHKKSESNE